MKRIFDLLIVCSTCIVIWPILVVISFLVIINHGLPILFRQQRPGLGGRPFWLLKFRTMTDARDGAGNLLPDVARLTAFGRFLRAASLDELPELLNVLKGDMSLVGPRPLLMQYLGRYAPEQARRHEVRPGITGWAQVNGRNSTTWEERFAHDIWYVDHQSFFLDCLIIIRTVVILFRGDGGVETAWQLGEYMGPNKEPNKTGIVSKINSDKGD